MSKDTREDDAKKIVKEETEPHGHSDVPRPKPPKPGARGIRGPYSKICGVTSRTPRIQKNE